MKKITVLLVALFAIVVGASAQKGEMSVGGQLIYGSEAENIGIGGRFQYGITEQLRLAPSFNFFLPKNDLTMFETNADIHYLFPIQDKLKLYPLGGLNLTFWSYDWEGMGIKVSDSGSDIGLNLGGGVQYDFTDKMMFLGELKYVIGGDYDQLVISAGVAFKF